jgi:hypothetical protein
MLTCRAIEHQVNLKEKAMGYTETWLKGLAFRKTKKGARLDLRFYIYPDGHGNIHYKMDDTGEDANLPVNGIGEAIDVFRAMWERAQQLKMPEMPQAPDEK